MMKDLCDMTDAELAAYIEYREERHSKALRRDMAPTGWRVQGACAVELELLVEAHDEGKRRSRQKGLSHEQRTGN